MNTADWLRPFFIYRIRDGELHYADMADTLGDAQARLQHTYRINSLHGDHFFIVDSRDGVISGQYVIEAEPQLVQL